MELLILAGKIVAVLAGCGLGWMLWELRFNAPMGVEDETGFHRLE